MKQIFVFIIIFCLSAVTQGQSDTLRHKPFQATLVYPIGTSGYYSNENAYQFSFNLLTGVTGAARGFELATIGNVNNYYNQGFQLAGIFNVNGSYTKGFQIAGILNQTGGYTDGIQLAGIYNISEAFCKGVQASAIFNIAEDSVNGAQITGIYNLTNELDGAQAAGIFNVAEDMRGIQIAGITNAATKAEKSAQVSGIGNIAEDIEGVQIAGIFNVAEHVKGMQLAGVVNICDSIDGVPLAMISIVRQNGYRRWVVWGSEAFHVNLSYKIGVRELYTIFSLGYKFGERHNNTGLGVGLGTNMQFAKQSEVEVEAHAYHISRHLWMEEDNFLYTLRINFAQTIGEDLAFFAGPAFNIIQAVPGSDAINVAPGYGIETRKSYTWRYWLGFNTGIRF